MVVLPPQLAVGSAITVAVPGVEIGHAACCSHSVEENSDVGYVVTCRRKKAGKPSFNHRADFFEAGHRWNIWAVVDDSISGEQRQNLVGLCPVEVIAIGMDNVGDCCLVEQAFQAFCVIHGVPIGLNVSTVSA